MRGLYLRKVVLRLPILRLKRCLKGVMASYDLMMI